MTSAPERPLHSLHVSNNGTARSGTRVQSVDRAVDILQYLAQNGWSGVTDVGNVLGVHKSTAFRVLSTLEARGLIEQHTESGKYHLGFGLVHLARAVTVRPDLYRHAQPSCQRLAAQAEESVTLAVLEGDEAVTIDQIVPEASVVSQSWLGRRTPLHATSHGKIFLAYLPKTRRAEIVRGPHEVLTPQTIVEPSALRAEIDLVMGRGYAVCSEELEVGLCSTAAAVHGSDGTVVAAVSISGPRYRMDDDRLHDLGAMVREAGAEISRKYGYALGVDGSPLT